MRFRSSSGMVDEREESANGLESALAGVAESSRQSRVTYAFQTEADAAAGWKVARMRLAEAVSAPYEAIVELTSSEGDEARRLLGRACTLSISRDDAQRTVHGIVQRVVHREPGMRGDAVTTARVHIVPALATLALRSDCRIFQDKTVPEVIDAVLTPALALHDRTYDARLRRADYARREYIVQHRESDLAFVERLMAEEGIWYAFVQPADADRAQAEILLLLDQNDDVPRAAIGHDGERLPIVRGQASLAHRQAISRFVLEDALAASSVHVLAHDWSHPLSPAQHAEPVHPGDYPRYEPYGVTLTSFRDERFLAADALAQARMRHEAHRGRAHGARGAGNVVALSPGQRVEVSVDPTHRARRAWIVTSVHARGRDAKRLDRGGRPADDYAMTFTCVRAEVPIRLSRRPKPRVHGVQTALVVGPDGAPEVAPGGDDVHVDAHGRVQVRFPWDRTAVGAPDATTTCFLRVAQGWAGSGFGFQFLPRVGMEVVVSFIDGDPDQPIVTGCLYNGLNRALYELPEHKTRSYLRTRSTPSGEGANELAFDDAAGHEQVALHAQRDHRVTVRRDQSIHVRGARRLSVGRDQTTEIAGHERHAVEKSRITTVRETEELAVGQDRRVEVTGSATTRIAGTRGLEVGQANTERYGKGRAIAVAGPDQLQVDGGDKFTHVAGRYDIVADATFQITQGATQLRAQDGFTVCASGDVQLENPGFQLLAQANGHTELRAERRLTLRVGRASLTIDENGQIALEGGRGGLFLDASGASLTGPEVSVAGTALAELKAPMVKIN